MSLQEEKTLDCVIFEYGKTITQDEMKPNSIYLDGACRGPHINNEKRSYSFDHHGGCSRFATLSTCQQVILALELGLDPRGMTIYVNDLDADTTLSVWLLLHPTRAIHDHVKEMVNKVGFVDSHGPVQEPSKLHKCLSHYGVEQSMEMLKEDLKMIDSWYFKGNEDSLPEPKSFPPCRAIGLDNRGMLYEYTAITGFSELYEVCVAGILMPEGPRGTVGSTIGKKSDFVSYDIQGFLNAMNNLESGWGGASTIGGAPRHSDGDRSCLPMEKVKEIFMSLS